MTIKAFWIHPREKKPFSPGGMKFTVTSWSTYYEFSFSYRYMYVGVEEKFLNIIIMH